MTDLLTPLRVHSYFSLHRAVPSPEALVERARADGLRALALTDYHALLGVVQFQRLCQAASIQPLLGMVVPVRVDGMAGGRPDELVLLAAGPAGYRSLSHLATHLQASPQREVLREHGLDGASLEANSQGLLCLTGGRRGLLERQVRGDRLDDGRRYARWVAALFPGSAYLALELHEAADAAVAGEIAAVGREVGLPAVAVQPVFLLDPADRPLLRLLAAIERNEPAAAIDAGELPNLGDPAVGLHWPSPAEMQAKFASFPAALDEIQAIVDRCEPALPDGRPLWPVLKLPEHETADEALTAAAWQGVEQRCGGSSPAIEARLERELALIRQHGFAPLFLILADVVRFAREQRIPVNTRGSVANSLVAYATGITHVDPLEHDLLFERFLNPARRELPDIDLDFCSRRRDEVLAYIRDTYGEDRVALVATINTYQPRSAVREMGKAHGLSGDAIDELSGRLPHGWHPDPRRRGRFSMADLLEEGLPAGQHEVIRWALRLLGFPSHLGLHPGGVVISPPPAMVDYCPLHLSPKGFLSTQFDHVDVEALGLVKVDLLGIRALSVIDRAARLIRSRRDPNFDLASVPDGEPATAALLAAGETIGCFQAESTGAMRTLRQLRAGTVRDLAVANAFFKPGPAAGGMAEAFVRRYRGEEGVSYLHPRLEPILAPTKGVLLFQEQIMRIVVEIAGLDWAEANQIRKGISKFQADRIQAVEARFVQGCRATSGFTAGQARTLWQQVLAFSGYGFNQGHATSYATPTYQMAYLKVHYLPEFLAARLAESGGYHHPAVYIAEARRLGLSVRPPHINHSQARFAVADDDTGGPAVLWAGLGMVRDLRRAAVRRLVAGRKQGLYRSLRDLLQRVDLQPREVTHLVQCGALDGLGESRNALLAEAETMRRSGGAGQLALFAFGGSAAVEAETAGRRLAWEKQLLGLPLSAHPADLCRRDPAMLPVASLAETAGRPVTTLGVRVPGGTGGRGFYLDDGRGMVLVREPGQERPLAWRPLIVRGRWRVDPWGGGWFQAESIALAENSDPTG